MPLARQAITPKQTFSNINTQHNLAFCQAYQQVKDKSLALSNAHEREAAFKTHVKNIRSLLDEEQASYYYGDFAILAKCLNIVFTLIDSCCDDYGKSRSIEEALSTINPILDELRNYPNISDALRVEIFSCRDVAWYYYEYQQSVELINNEAQPSALGSSLKSVKETVHQERHHNERVFSFYELASSLYYANEVARQHGTKQAEVAQKECYDYAANIAPRDKNKKLTTAAFALVGTALIVGVICACVIPGVLPALIGAIGLGLGIGILATGGTIGGLSLVTSGFGLYRLRTKAPVREALEKHVDQQRPETAHSGPLRR